MAGHDETVLAVNEFELFLALAEKVQTVVPFGVPNFKNKEENAFIAFRYIISQSAVSGLYFEIFNAEGQLLYHDQLSADQTTLGTHFIYWDGFDLEEVYDSRRFDGQKLEARLNATTSLQTKSISTFFYAQYKEVQWLDVKIERKSKDITATLRTNFRVRKQANNNKVSKIPTTALAAIGKNPIETLTKSPEELVNLAMDGLSFHWSRNHLHPEEKNIRINKSVVYEFYLNIDNTLKRTIKSPAIVFQTNARSRRSRNWELSRILFYNLGYLKHRGKWYFKTEKKTDADFKEIAAHEIGHEILLAYGGHIYSKGHKGSSTLITQSPLGNFLYPQKGEIDLMLYYAADESHPFPADANSRSIASEKDVLSLLWLSKIQIRQV